MNVFEFVDRIKKGVNEETTVGDIAYLPSGFIPVSQAIRALASMKKRWNIEILDNKHQYHVNFEDKLKVRVNKPDFKDFTRRVLRVEKVIMPVMEVDLSQHLEEAADDVESLYEQIHASILEWFVNRPLSEVDLQVADWEKKFGKVEYLTPPKTLLKFETLEADVELLMKKIRAEYADDRGQLELLLSTIKDKQPLSGFDVFRSYDNLLGTRIHSSYSGVDLIFEVNVPMNFRVDQTIKVSDEDLADEMSGYRSVKVVGNVLFPLGGKFPFDFFSLLKKNIDDMPEEEVPEDEQEV